MSTTALRPTPPPLRGALLWQLAVATPTKKILNKMNNKQKKQRRNDGGNHGGVGQQPEDEVESPPNKKPVAVDNLDNNACGRRRTGSVNTVMSSESSSNSNSSSAENAQGVAGTAVDNSTATSTSTTSELNILEFLQSTTCPKEILPKVLAYCGPQLTLALSKTNKHWNDLVQQESTWRILCEELYKWKVGEPEPTTSWLEHYISTPCVPVDYRSIPAALLASAATAKQQEATNPNNRRIGGRRNATPPPGQNNRQTKSITVLLRPGRYCLKQAIDIETTHVNVQVSISTMELPSNLYRPPQPPTRSNTTRYSLLAEQPLPPAVDRSPRSPSSPSSRRAGGPSFRNLFSCQKRTTSDQDELLSETEEMDYYLDEPWLLMDHPYHPNIAAPPPIKHATIILRSRYPNEPVFRIRRGTLKLSNIEIQHNSHGLDIWNGNAAVQIQPPPPTPRQPNNNNDERPPPPPLVAEPRPCALLDHVHISSKSGRGIVNIDGGKLVTERCVISDCAATGIYVGGPGSEANISYTDVIRNGLGKRRGIARGHSGIYLEQGLAVIDHTSISNNTLTGISVVSPDNAILKLSQSDLIGNGTYQLELPPLGTTSRQRTETHEDNVLSIRGEPAMRSGLMMMLRRSHSSMSSSSMSSSTHSLMVRPPLPNPDALPPPPLLPAGMRFWNNNNDGDDDNDGER